MGPIPQDRLRQWEQQRLAANAPQLPAPKQKTQGRGGFLSSIISELGGAGGAAGGAAIGTALLPGIGTIIGGGLGGLLGGFGGKAVEQKVRDDQNVFGSGGSFRKDLGEGALSGVLGGAGEAFNVLKAGKAATGEKGLLNIGKNFRAGTNALGEGQLASRFTRAAEGLKKSGAGAFDVGEGFRAVPNAEARLATIEKYNIPSGRAGLEKGTKVIANLEGDLQPILKTTKIPVTDATQALDDILANTSADITDGALNRTISSQKKAIANAAKDGIISGDELRSIRSKLGDGIFSGTETARKDLLKEIYRSYGDIIGEKAPQAKALLGEQHSLLDLEKGLSKKAEGAKIPLFGTGFKSSAAGRVRDTTIDKLSGALGKAGAVTGNPVGANLMRRIPFSLSSALGGGVAQTDQTQPLPDTTTPMMDPTQGLGAPQQQAPSQSPYSQANLISDIQRDPKNQAQYLSLYKTLNDASASTSSGPSNVGKLSAQNYLYAKNGIGSLQKLASLLQSDPGVVSRANTPGQGLPIVGGYVKRAAGTSQYKALANNVIDTLLRARTGAQANKEEIAQYSQEFIPQAGDREQDVQAKLQNLYELFQETLNLGGDQSAGLAGAISQ